MSRDLADLLAEARGQLAQIDGLLDKAREAAKVNRDRLREIRAIKRKLWRMRFGTRLNLACAERRQSRR